MRKIAVLGILGRTTNQRKTLALGRVQGRRSLAEVACFGPEIVKCYSVIYSIIKVEFKYMFHSFIIVAFLYTRNAEGRTRYKAC